MDKQPYVDRILETENLTDNLEDPDANWLLNWGLGRLNGVLQGAEDEDTAGERTNALMGVMRKINRIAGSYTSESAEELAEDLADLDSRWNKAFGGESAEKSAAELQPQAEQLTRMNTRQLLETLTRESFTPTEPPKEPPAAPPDQPTNPNHPKMRDF